LYNSEGNFEDYEIYSDDSKNFYPDFNIILSETNHHIFYNKYSGPKIAYNVWESTLQPTEFFEKILEYDEIWVPSKWQAQCTIEQGADPDKVKVVPEGVDVHTFYPEEVEKLDDYNDNRFKFILFGRWDYRKSTKEIIQTFLQTFSEDEPVDLIVSIDNMWGEEMDGFKTTEDRLDAYGLTDPRIKVVHFPTRENYIKYRSRICFLCKV
jgi:glycosyltransferase involved in cell wall biosynthesis